MNLTNWGVPMHLNGLYLFTLSQTFDILISFNKKYVHKTLHLYGVMYTMEVLFSLFYFNFLTSPLTPAFASVVLKADNFPSQQPHQKY